MQQSDKWIEGKVAAGSQHGRILGYPTANFDPKLLRPSQREGVYAAYVLIDGSEYVGALYYGPRLVLDETKRVLEIFVLDFDENLYDKTIRFKLGKFIREPIDFDSFDALKLQINADVAAIRAAA